MWRAFFLAIWLSLVILGAEFMAVEQVELHKAPPEGSAINTLANMTSMEAINATTLVPPEWAPWLLFSAGAVVMLYSFTIPKRVRD